RWYDANSLSYETAQPYGLFQRLIRRACEIAENDPPDALTRKFSVLLDPLPADQHAHGRHVLAGLFALQGDASAPSTGSGRPLEGETFKWQLVELIGNLARYWSAESPIVLAFDDLQWADPASMALLLHLLTLTDRMPMLLLCAFRPDRQSPAWQIKVTAERDYPHRYREIMLNPLPAADSAHMLDHLLNSPDTPPRLREIILEKAEGNPLFIEEVVRTLLDASPPGPLSQRTASSGEGESWGEAHLSIPDTLQSLLVSRIDRLEEEARHTLQMAAVIGRSFAYRVLAAIAGGAADSELHAAKALDKPIATLLRADLIREASRLPELEYSFRQALAQEAVYNTVLLARRREFHRRAGEAIESLFPHRRQELAAVLAYHFAEARADDKALAYYTLAGDVAFRLYANTEAITHYSHALECARRGRANDADSAQWVHLYTRRGRALELNAKYDEALANYAEMEALASKLHAAKARERGPSTGSGRALELAALIGRVPIYATFTPAHDPPKGRALAEQALALARELDDRAAEAKILWSLSLLNGLSDRVPEAVEQGERAVAIARELGLREQQALALTDLTRAHMFSGNLDHAKALIREAIGLWRELGNLPMLANALSTSYTVLFSNGDFAEMTVGTPEALQISQSTHNLWGQSFSQIWLGSALAEQGDPDRALAAMQSCLQLGDQSGFVGASMTSSTQMALLYGELGAVAEGMAVAQAGLSKIETRAPAFQPPLLMALAKLHLISGDLSAADQTASRIHFKPGSVPARMALPLAADLALAHGNPAGAVAAADEFLVSLRQQGLRWSAPYGLAVKGRALLAQGEFDQAEAVLGEARRLAEAMGALRPLWPVLFLLGQIAERRGKADEANALRARAREIVQFIADHIARPDLRASFLNQTEARALIRDV
ncbi:MAG: AAA family ATPase, partial [Chloroflexi bacterium]|nr:AAA family ATPase [Chloroflexota bacterium]